MPVKSDPAKRFWAQIDKRGPVYKNLGRCWLWTGHLNKLSGKGAIWVAPKMISAPRFSYQLLIGDLEPGLYVCHHCDTPACVNPKHLFKGTQDDNMKDMKRKGRANKPQGESNGRAKLTEDNVRYIRRNYKFRDPKFGQKALSEKFKVCVLTIQKAIDGRFWSHID